VALSSVQFWPGAVAGAETESSRKVCRTVPATVALFAVLAVSAAPALGTFPSDDSRTSPPVRRLFRISAPVSRLLRMSAPVRLLLRISAPRTELFLISRLSIEPVATA